MPSPSKLKQSARSGIGELISWLLRPLPLTMPVSVLKWQFVLPRSKAWRTPKNLYLVAQNKLQFHIGVRGSLISLHSCCSAPRYWEGSCQVVLSLVTTLSFQLIVLFLYQLLWEEQGQGKVAKTVDCPYPSISLSVPFRQKRPLIQLPLPPQKLATQTDPPS